MNEAKRGVLPAAMSYALAPQGWLGLVANRWPALAWDPQRIHARIFLQAMPNGVFPQMFSHLWCKLAQGPEADGTLSGVSMESRLEKLRLAAYCTCAAKEEWESRPRGHPHHHASQETVAGHRHPRSR